jgi:hypothetical protein
MTFFQVNKKRKQIVRSLMLRPHSKIHVNLCLRLKQCNTQTKYVRLHSSLLPEIVKLIYTNLTASQNNYPLPQEATLFGLNMKLFLIVKLNIKLFLIVNINMKLFLLLNSTLNCF